MIGGAHSARMMLPRLSKGSVEMENLDRLGWGAGVSFRAYGLRIGVRANNAEVLEQVKDRLAFGWTPAKSPIVDKLYSIVGRRTARKPNVKRFNLLYKGAVRLARSMDLDEALNELEIDMHSYIATATRQRMFLHAGVVGWRGQAVVISGKNFSGKTSLVTAFLRAGATYYSDEFAVLDSRGRVHPYPWALHIREEAPGCVADCRNYRIGDDEAGVVFLRELLEPRSKIYRVADRGELLAPRRADIAGDGVAYVQPDANPQRPSTVGEVAPVDFHEDLLCRGNGMMSGGRVLKRRAEDRHKGW